EGGGDLIAVGGVDTVTGLDFGDDTLVAVPGSTVLSPLTTLLSFADDQNVFFERTGLALLFDAEPDFDVLDYTPFLTSGAVDGEIGELILFLNQQASILVSAVRTIAEIIGEADPLTFAYQSIANNLVQADPDTVLVLFDDILLMELSNALIDAGAIEGQSADTVVNAIAELLVSYLVPLAENTATGVDPFVTALMQESIVNLESLLVELASGPDGFARVETTLSNGLSEVNTSLGDWSGSLMAADNAPLFAARSGSTVEGTAERDVLRGRAGDDVLRGLGGDDFIFGQHGDDIIDGGDGQDILRKFFGTGLIFGGAGDDDIDIAYADVEIDGGAGNDTLRLYRGFSELASNVPESVYTIDLGNNTLRQEANGSILIDATVTNIEQIELRFDEEVFFTGGDGNDGLGIEGTVATIFPSGGQDNLQSRAPSLGVPAVTVDFSQQDASVTVTKTFGTSLLEYEFGSFSSNIGTTRIIGSDFGDEFSLFDYDGDLQLGSGPDTVHFSEQPGNLQVFGFETTGINADTIFFSAEFGVSAGIQTIDDVLSRFTQSQTEINGEAVPVAIFVPQEFIPGEVRFINVLVSDLGPENIILPMDTV
ncbi:MAG: hypothetical protein AAF607_13410, partial [Pseudomonadota bacterium]